MGDEAFAAWLEGATPESWSGGSYEKAAHSALLPSSRHQGSAGLEGHIWEELQQLAIESQQATPQLLGKHHELSVVAGAARLDRQLQNPLAIHGFFLQCKALNGLTPEGNRLGGLKDPRTHILQGKMAKL